MNRPNDRRSRACDGGLKPAIRVNFQGMTASDQLPTFPNWHCEPVVATTSMHWDKGIDVLLQIVLATLAFGAAPVPEDAAPQCAVRYTTRFVTHFADLPDQIQKDILKGGKIADASQPFEAYDIITDPDLPRRRMVLAGYSHLKWFVWIDHGGFARHNDVFGFSQVWEKRDTFRWYRDAELRGDPCIAIDAFLDGVSTPEEIEK